MQTAVPSAFPLFQTTMRLSFTQIGWVAFVLNITASCCSRSSAACPTAGRCRASCRSAWRFRCSACSASRTRIPRAAARRGRPDRRRRFRPPSGISRVARMAAGRGRGMAQSVFQVGGNTGRALAPLLVGFVLLPLGQRGFLWFTVAAVLGIAVQTVVGRWYKRQLAAAAPAKKAVAAVLDSPSRPTHSRLFVAGTMTLLIALLFSKFVYIAGMTDFYAFHFMERYHLPLDRANLPLRAAVRRHGRHAARRTARRPLRPQNDDLDFRRGDGAVFAAAAACRPGGRAPPLLRDRHDSHIRLLRHHRLRAGAAAASRRHGIRPLLRPFVRHGRPRLRAAGAD